MNPVLTIARKRDGHKLSSQEIAAIVAGFSCGEIPDYQMSALAMAICIRGMDEDETAALTDAMLGSGTRLLWKHQPEALARGTSLADASGWHCPIVDKHSTGGIGDKTSLILAPLLACCGLAVPMISGRGLGATGGTLDKLESIPGFRTDLTLSEIRDQVERVGCVITGATADLAPADKKLYALRDVTATVESIPLITASIMSKKLAEGLGALVLDVKFGSGAFMKSLADARRLAHSLVATGKRLGVKTTVLVTDMNQPLGRMAGNAVEVDEAIAALTPVNYAGRAPEIPLPPGEGGFGHRREALVGKPGEGRPADLLDLTYALAAELLLATGSASTAADALATLQSEIASGRALAKFREMVAAQGGDLDAPRPIAPASDICAEKDGFVAAIDGEQLGIAVIELGGGRRLLTDPIDHSVGLEMLARLGDRVTRGMPLVRLFSPPAKRAAAAARIVEAITIRPEPREPPPLIVERIN
jgi:thymidine phosphorylase